MHDSEQLLDDLRKRSTTIVPLKQRRTNIKRPTTVESLCDWETDKVELLHLKTATVADVQLLLTLFKREPVLSHHHHHQESLARGQKLSLKSNSDPEKWDVICPDGSTQSFPGVCFQIPPPDPEAIDRVNLYVLQSACTAVKWKTIFVYLFVCF